MKFSEFSKIVVSEENAVKWAQLNGLLNVLPQCKTCDSSMKSYSGLKGTEELFRCTKSGCMTSCTSRSGTIFNKSRLDIKTLISIIFFWSIEISSLNTSMLLSVSEGIICKWRQKIRDILDFFLAYKSDFRIGGVGKIVEIDESMFSKRKYNRGRIQQSQTWIFGGVVRGESDNCFIEIVPNRSMTTLLEIITKRIHPGTTIATDGWKAYADLEEKLPQMNFKQLKVNHSENFVNPSNHDAHTQTIEGFWSHLKRKLRQKGLCKKRRLGKHISEEVYRKKCKGNVFDQFVKDLNEFY